ncbi:MAG: glycosyltransferase family 1 protein [Vicinamibacterales bacterium]|nr:glycosyltransferase family 1 protein [Vicinamibacterales bacterium]
MRILIDYRPALRQRTGVGLWVARLVEALAERQETSAPEITVFSSSWKDRLVSDLPAGVTGVDRRVPVSLLNWLWHRMEWPDVASLAPGDFDVVHSPSPLLIPARSAARVVTIHDVDFLRHPERGTREIRRDYPLLARAHAHRADAVVVPSAHTADEVSRRLDLPRDRISVCHNGAPDWPARRQQPATGHLLFVGTITPRKNVDRLLTAYAQVRARRPCTPPLVLAGRSTRQSRQTLARLASPSLAGHVRHEGYVDDHRLRALYEEALVVVLPSLDEGFGIPALEAMAVGAPVVAAARGALPEVVGDAGLLVDPLDVSALAATLERVITDEPFRHRLSAAGPARAARFSWRSSAEALRGAYRRAIERRRQRLATCHQDGAKQRDP